MVLEVRGTLMFHFLILVNKEELPTMNVTEELMSQETELLA